MQLKQRLVSSLHQAIEIIDQEETQESNQCECLKTCCIPSHSLLTKEIIPPRFSIPNRIGFTMTKELFLPVLPYFLRDIWILVELIVTIVQVVLAAISIPNSTNIAATVSFLILASVNTILAVLDAVIYYYELGSYKYFCSTCRKTDDLPSLRAPKINCKGIHLSEKKKKLLNQWFEVLRTVLSELLLYPLIVFDLFDVGRSGFISFSVDFSIFLISTLYMVLSVYLARIVITLFTLRSLLKLLSKTETGPSNVRFVVRFFAHVLAQIVVHLCCIVAVGLKIHLENTKGSGFSVSAVLWVAMVGGWLVPFIGVLMFFVANYFWAQQYSVGLCVEMMSLIQVPNIAQSLFKSSDNIDHDATIKSQLILEKMQYSKLKEDYHKKLEKVDRITKLAYPGRVHIFMLVSFLYVILLLSFFVSLLLEIDKRGHVRVVDTDKVENIFIIGCIIVVAVANIHILLLTPCLPQVNIYSICKKMMK